MVLNRYLAFATFFLAGAAYAENGCPPGQLPAQANGAITSCTPIPPGYYQQQGQTPAAPRPSGRWLKTWGAIAVGSIDTTTSYGVTTGKLSQAEAEADALRRCASHGETDCKVVFRYRNQCVAIAEPQIDGRPLDDAHVKFISAASIPEASSHAISDCKEANRGSSGDKCKIIYTACTEQVFEKF
ncbi:DUF4189 domain-containing protein [Xanthomonas sacchari]|uniref:DUF4189 domain-containing protein n=1 Tax=Xanthomonas sp. SHU 308 TaxID=1591201 RepID=UPI0009DB641C|nr:DUF4189 domain-containing protein [Xanthomonas sp. SHU 308]